MATTPTKKPAGTRKAAAPKAAVPAADPSPRGEDDSSLAGVGDASLSAGVDDSQVPYEAAAEEEPASWSPAVGDVVEYSYFDHYAGAGGEQVTVLAQVVGLDDTTVCEYVRTPNPDGTETVTETHKRVPGARVVLLPQASAAIPLDQLTPA